jgi:WW domain-containing oxidoreductase
MMSYNDSKLCNVAFAAWLQRHLVSALRRRPRDVLCFSVHPGNLFSSSFQNQWWLLRLLYFLVRPFTKSLAQAAATSCFAATAGELAPIGGCYLNNCCVTVPGAAALDVGFQDKLAELSVRMIEDKMGVGSCSFSQT